MQIDEKQNIEFWRQNGIKLELMNKFFETVPEDFFLCKIHLLLWFILWSMSTAH